MQKSPPVSGPPSRAEAEANAEFDERLQLVEQAIDQYGSYLFNYLHGLTRQYQDAEDLYTSLWVFALHKFPIEKLTHVGLLRTKAYQLFIDHYRKQQRNPLVNTEALPEPVTPPAPQDVLSDEEDEAFKTRFFEEHPADLTKGQKDALWLHARHGYTFKEISRIMEMPASTVGDWIKQARTKLADFING